MKHTWCIWAARISILLLMAYLSLLTVNIIGMNIDLREKLQGILAQNIPSLVLLVILFWAWKRPLLGVIIFGILAITLTVFIWSGEKQISLQSTLLLAPMFSAAVFFFLAHLKNKE
jgi:hypothetical protein